MSINEKSDNNENFKSLFHLLDSRKLDEVIKENSIDLVVTSPPYPHVEMWNSLFIELDPTIPPVSEWNISNAFEIFEKMHVQLDIVWTKLFKVVKESGIVVINVGDATRTFPITKGSKTKQFQLFPNASRITMAMMEIGFICLPNIYWKKISNKPNAFMGSGFLPVNAYVTSDCEHILIFRKGNIRKFKTKDENRKKSEFTKEERDLWFSQTWTGINGVKQTRNSESKGVTKGVNDKNKERTGAFPEEIPRRLIRTYSVKGDTILDPFCGTKTTLKVAEKLERKSIGLDIKDI